MSSSESIPDEMLSAYLDGELAPEERRQVEVALESDSQLRVLLADLKQLRSEIQDLPRFQLNEDFAKRVAVAAQESHVSQAPASESVVNKPTVSRPQTYQSRLRMVAGMAAAAAAIFVACWAMFPNGSGQQQVSDVDLSSLDEQQARPLEDLARAEASQAEATDSMMDDSMEADEIVRDAMSLDGFAESNPNANSFEQLQMGEAEDTESFHLAEQVTESRSRFAQPPVAASDALAAEPVPADASLLELQAATPAPATSAAPAAAPAPEMLADSNPTTPVERSFGVGFGGRGGSRANASATASAAQLGQSRSKPAVDAVLYLAKTDTLALRNKKTADFETDMQPIQLRYSRGRDYSYRKYDLSKQRSLSASVAAIANSSFEGITIPAGSELLVLEGTPEQVRAALLEVGATPTSVNVLSPKADELALTTLAAADNLPRGLNKAQSRMMRSATPTRQLNESKKVSKKAKLDADSDSEDETRVRVLLVVSPK